MALLKTKEFVALNLSEQNGLYERQLITNGGFQKLVKKFHLPIRIEKLGWKELEAERPDWVIF